MSSKDLPLLIEPEQLKPILGSDGLLVVDLCKDTTYAQLHIPGAVHLAYQRFKGYPGSWSDWGNRADTPKVA